MIARVASASRLIRYVDFSLGAAPLLLSAPTDASRTASVALAPYAALDGAVYCDWFVLSGTVDCDGVPYLPRSFLRCNAGTALHAGSEGALLLQMGRSAVQVAQACSLRSANELHWQPGYAEKVHIALLALQPDRIALAAFQAGARVPEHTHTRGEDLLVLEGTLYDHGGAYPRGTWMRIPPHEAHAPWAEKACLVLLRTGHVDLSQQVQKTKGRS
jgi:ChrR Cupin-like domain